MLTQLPTNEALAEIFSDIAVRCEIKGDENPFAIRAYKAVSDTIAGYQQPISNVWREGGLEGLTAIKGIGKEIAKKIDELMRTGTLDFYTRLCAAVPDSVAAMLKVPGFGPKRIKLVWDELGVDSIEVLEKYAKEGKLRALPKFGAKLESKIVEGISALKRLDTGRKPITTVWPVAETIRARLAGLPQVLKVAYAGSLRRGRETIGDLDFVVATNAPAPVMAAFVGQDTVETVLGQGETKSSVRLNTGLQVDLRTVAPGVWGTAMQYFTGSQQHNIRLREIAQRAGFSLNEYALSVDGENVKGGPDLTFDTEEALYERLGLNYVPPELRENRGEFETHVPPLLIRQNQLKGDLQMHTTWSDGATDILTMARTCVRLGYSYIAVTDHTQGLGVVNGLTPKKIADQRRDIDGVNDRLRGEGITFRVLQGVECEVKSDGSLDMPDDVLAGCDWVQASIHTSLTQPRDQITTRVTRALNNPYVDVLGHPAGRLIGEREGADYDWDAVFLAAKSRSVAVEINATRIDLSDVLARRAHELGCMFTISTDAHSPEMLHNMHYGVITARRAWVTSDVVLNTLPLQNLLDWIKNRRRR